MRICVMVVAGFSVHFKPFSLSVEYQMKKRLGTRNYFKLVIIFFLVILNYINTYFSWAWNIVNKEQF